MKSGDIFFKKTGRELKSALSNKKKEYDLRLVARKEKFNKFINNPEMVFSYFMQDSDLSQEKREELHQIGSRISEIESEVKRIDLQLENINDNEIYTLSYYDLVNNGFD